jgi:hypothetical protein
MTGQPPSQQRLYKHLINRMNPRDLMDIVAKQTHNGTIIQMKVRVFCINQNNAQVFLIPDGG